MKTYEFTRLADGMVMGTIAAESRFDAAEKLSATEARLWGQVWLREVNGNCKSWWEHKYAA